MRPAVLLAVVVAGLMAAAPASAAAAGSTLRAETAAPAAKVLIRFRQPPRGSDTAAIAALGGTVRFSYRAIPALAARLPEHAVTALLRNPNVLEIERDHPITAFDHIGATGDLEYENQWGVEHIGAKPVHDAGVTGTGVRVAIIDTGIDHDHTDLSASPPIYPEFLHHWVNGRVPGWDFVNNDDDPDDDNGHGTHVAGILAAEKNGYLISGVAPDVDLFALKVLGASGEGDYSGLIAALDWSIANGMDVVNMSLGGREISSTLAAMVAAADAAGIVMVAASGNVNPLVWQELFYGCPVAYPAAYPQVLATTFTNGSDALTGYSCTGSEVDFAAPGDQIVSTVPIGPLGSCMFCDPKGYSWQSGTSMASPHLAGAVALVLDQGIQDADADGRLMPEIKAHLCANTVPGTSTSSRWTYAQMFGCGVINVRNALVVNPPDTGEPPPPNGDPVAGPDDATTAEDTPVAIPVLANDTDPDDDALAVVAAGPAGNGSVAVNADGSVTYTPAANWSGEDAFEYTVDDGHGGSATGTVTVTVSPANDPPTAVADTATTAYGTTIAIDVLANDSDIDGDGLSVAGVGPAGHGTVGVGPGGTVSYTPAAGFSGPDSFSYTVSDGSASAVGLVSVTVGAPPAAPVLHVADLDRLAAAAKKSWTATVRIRVVDQLGSLVAGVTVTGTWSGAKGSFSCVTDATGWCQVSRTYQSSKASATFSVTRLSLSGATYDSSANTDPDDDSNGTSITVARP